MSYQKPDSPACTRGWLESFLDVLTCYQLLKALLAPCPICQWPVHVQNTWRNPKVCCYVCSSSWTDPLSSFYSHRTLISSDHCFPPTVNHCWNCLLLFPGCWFKKKKKGSCPVAELADKQQAHKTIYAFFIQNGLFLWQWQFLFVSEQAWKNKQDPCLR